LITKNLTFLSKTLLRSVPFLFLTEDSREIDVFAEPSYTYPSDSSVKEAPIQVSFTEFP
jgi:hypothetical protein